ncbi:MAG: bifunctional folylpolyglutamate synthase/dihydrofolate synthase [Firmicutes bacterium]|nr:bifunctional folylpolyglutamate synthase/dihydrofolate synthase [Bacillota bacterium]
MDYQEALAYLKQLNKFGMNLGLRRIERLLELLGQPHRQLRVIHVAGTNGKGSTCAMISQILQAGGYRVGLYTSPHLHSYTERIRLDGQPVKEADFARLLTTIQPLVDQILAEGYDHPTEFEVLTAAGLLFFCQERVDLAVIEVGLGGLLDSTNVVKPLVSVITNVSFDHLDQLGTTLPEIAQAKAGIIKPGVPVVAAADQVEVLRVIEKKCAAQRAPLIRIGQDVRWVGVASSIKGQTFNVSGREFNYDNLFIRLLGKHQLVNATTAVTVAHLLNQQNITIPEPAIRRGLAEATWPGRLEIIRTHPWLVVDGAHNQAGAETLAVSLQEYFAYTKLILVIGMLDDKERDKVLAILGPLADTVVVTRPPSTRAVEWQTLGSLARRYTEQIYLEENVEKAVRLALQLAGPDDLVCFTGSLYLIAEIRALLLRGGNMEPSDN